ncbi:hypothetical protein ASE16_08970 [Leifsonia sp. Root227]|uniref:DUF1648 domain-containing protein n=1 Tax=Leifsonia sp. Root227 TaxID=1736496 RepID=UPI0006F8533B|nr:DUF1648 domain-containing protein [Leifsonia sp. Root227]KRC51055.1 hypothetical protein ASE16_08970 [Leifsonia sp. Root227]
MRGRGVYRRIIALLLSLIPLGWLIVTAVTVGPRLGQRMASHWSGSATPDGFADPWLSFWMFAAIVAGLTVGAVALVVSSRTSAPARLWAGIVVALAGLSALAWTAPAEATAAAATPEEAVLGVRLLLLIPVAALGALVAIVLPSADPAPLDEDDDAQARPTPPLRSGDRLVWSGTTGSVWFGAPAIALVAGGVCCLVVSIATATPGLIAPAVILLLVGCTLLLLARVRLSVDARGIRLVSTVFLVPLIRVRLDDVERVSAEQISPLRWGGWGYRISTRGIAYVTRRSEGLVITRRRGVDIAITIDGAEQASAAAELLVDQRRESARRTA